MASRTPSASLRTLVAGLVDYAGLFPPAALDMAHAVAEYAGARASPGAWMLGRFVVPVARLHEFAAEASARVGASESAWRVSALAGDDAAADAARIATFNASQRGRLVVDAAEVRASSAEQVESAARALGQALTVYVELPREPDPRALLAVVRHAGARAKIRTGGVTADAIPTAGQVARFLARCAELRVPFKATAGLHHPLRGEHRLTYEAGAPSATMFGFLNVFMGGVLALGGAGEEELAAVLDERRPSAFTFGSEGASWRERHASVEQISRARDTFAVAFGSCSFREPVDDLEALALT